MAIRWWEATNVADDDFVTPPAPALPASKAGAAQRPGETASPGSPAAPGQSVDFSNMSQDELEAYSDQQLSLATMFAGAPLGSMPAAMTFGLGKMAANMAKSAPVSGSPATKGLTAPTAIQTYGGGTGDVGQTSGANTASGMSDSAMQQQMDVMAGVNKGVNDQGAGSVDGGETVICTELFRQGLMDVDTLMADQRFGFKVDDTLYKGYRVMADPIVVKMQNSPSFSLVVYHMTKPWVTHMAFNEGVGNKGSITGRVLWEIGSRVCWTVGAISEWRLKNDRIKQH